jgi:CHAT domain-containing protein/tetratricopeptide (TPR) repeat protein
MVRLNAPGAIVGVWLSVVSAGVPGSAVARADVESLPPGEALTRELAAGEAHVFLVQLEKGDLLEGLVEQQGVDVALTVVEPDGTAALDVDLRHDPMRVERVLWIARASGAHSLRIRAKPDRPSGHYRIVLDPPRPANPADDRRVSAQKDYAEAVRLEAEEKEQTIPQERRLLERALEVFRSTGDRRGEAAAREAFSVLEVNANRLPQALASAEAALASYRELHDRAGEATALRYIATATCAAGDSPQCRERFEAAIRLARDISDGWLEAICLDRLGSIYRRAGEAEKAIEWHRQSLAKSLVTGDRESQASALNDLGIDYKELGEYDHALAYYEQAVVVLKVLKYDANVARAYNNMGNVYKLIGDKTRARDFYLRYLALARERDPGGDDEARALVNLGGLLSQLGEYEEGLADSRRSFEIRKALGDVTGQSSSLNNVGDNLNKLGRNEEALTALTEALRIRRSLGERYGEATTLLGLATVERDLGQLREALSHAEAAVNLTEELRSATTNPDLRASFVAAEQDKYGFYVDLLMRLHEKEGRAGHDAAALQASERARARVLLEALIEARADIRQGIDPELLASERALQKQLSGASRRLARLLARPAPAADVARTRAELEATSEKYREVQSQIRTRSPRYAALTQPAPTTVEQIRRELLDDDTVLLEYYLGEERSFLWAVTPAELVSQALPKSAQIEAAARSVHGLLTARQRTRALASTRESDRRLQEESMALSRLLLGRIASRLDTDWKDKRLLIVASGALAYLPFGALPSPVGGAARPLLRDHEIVFAPSASVLIALRREHARAPRAGTSVAVLADPVFEMADPRVHNRSESATPAAPAPTGLTRAAESLGHGFTRLPFSRGEADAIAALVPRASLLEATDFAANRTLVAEGGLGDRAIVHFATHGLLDSEHPDLSGLVLSLVDEKGTPQDGFLRMHEIYNLRLPADLVVLSACQTALGREIRGEGLVGLTRGFMYAGARGVVASLWQVDDESTAELMKRFYRAMLKEGRRPAAALRNAQLELSRHPRWAAPFYWAGFVLQGEWR